MNILLISFIFSPNLGGVESHLDDLTTYLGNRGYKVIVITYQPLLLDRSAPYIEKRGNVEIRRIPWIKFNLFNRLETKPILQALYLVPAILFYTSWYLLKKGKDIDVIQTHGFNMAIVGAFASILFRKRFVANTHVLFSFVERNLYTDILKLVLNQATKILVLTHGAKKELAKIGVKKDKIIIYHQWIDTSLFSPRDRVKSRNKFKLNQNVFIVCFAGRFMGAKGITLLLKAAGKIKNGIFITFVGQGELKETIQKEAKKNPAVHLIGEIRREDLSYYYSAADVCIIPSTPTTTTYSEGIPRVMIEAFFCATPVIATKTGGVRELVTSDVGFFVEPKADAIAELIHRLSSNRKILERMRKRCIEYAKEQFDFKSNAAIIENSLL